MTAYSASFKALDFAKAKIASVALANEKMEELRNMPYDSLSTEHGAIYPPGTILDDEEITRKGVRFNVHTTISYVDDPYDGNAEGTIAGKPTDIYPYDYKKAEITATKIGVNNFYAKLSSNFSSKAAETPSNSGIIKICVVDATGNPVSGATVSINNPEPSPAVDITSDAGLDGCVMVPNLPLSSQNQYNLSATMTGYSTDSTYPRTAQNPNATFPDVDVLTQQVTNQTLIIDRLSKLKIDLFDQDGNPISNTNVHVEGSKEIYFNPPTFKYSSDNVTDGNGHIELNNMEFDSYKILVPGWHILSTSPYQAVGLKPNTDLTVKVIASQNSSLPTIISCEPLSAMVGQTASVTINGDNFNNVSVKLISQTNAEIAGTNVSVSGNKIIDADFNLSGATTGLYDIIITNDSGQSVKQEKGFEVLTQ